MDRSERIERLRAFFPPGWDDDDKLALDRATTTADVMVAVATIGDNRLARRMAREAAEAAMAENPDTGAILTAKLAVAAFIRSGLPVPEPLRGFAEQAIFGEAPAPVARLAAKHKVARDMIYALALDAALREGAETREAAYIEVAEAAKRPGSDTPATIKRLVTRYNREERARMDAMPSCDPFSVIDGPSE